MGGLWIDPACAEGAAPRTRQHRFLWELQLSVGPGAHFERGLLWPARRRKAPRNDPNLPKIGRTHRGLSQFYPTFVIIAPKFANSTDSRSSMPRYPDLAYFAEACAPRCPVGQPLGFGLDRDLASGFAPIRSQLADAAHPAPPSGLRPGVDQLRPKLVDTAPGFPKSTEPWSKSPIGILCRNLAELAQESAYFAEHCGRHRPGGSAEFTEHWSKSLRAWQSLPNFGRPPPPIPPSYPKLLDIDRHRPGIGRNCRDLAELVQEAAELTESWPRTSRTWPSFAKLGSTPPRECARSPNSCIAPESAEFAETWPMSPWMWQSLPNTGRRPGTRTEICGSRRTGTMCRRARCSGADSGGRAGCGPRAPQVAPPPTYAPPSGGGHSKRASPRAPERVARRAELRSGIECRR